MTRQLLNGSQLPSLRAKCRHTYSGGLTFYRYLGPGRHTETDFLHKQAIVFTTYATLATDFCSGKNALADINWFRIVLDEGMCKHTSVIKPL